MRSTLNFTVSLVNHIACTTITCHVTGEVCAAAVSEHHLRQLPDGRVWLPLSLSDLGWSLVGMAQRSNCVIAYILHWQQEGSLSWPAAVVFQYCSLNFLSWHLSAGSIITIETLITWYLGGLWGHGGLQTAWGQIWPQNWNLHPQLPWYPCAYCL